GGGPASVLAEAAQVLREWPPGLNVARSRQSVIPADERRQVCSLVSDVVDFEQQILDKLMLHTQVPLLYIRHHVILASRVLRAGGRRREIDRRKRLIGRVLRWGSVERQILTERVRVVAADVIPCPGDVGSEEHRIS